MASALAPLDRVAFRVLSLEHRADRRASFAAEFAAEPRFQVAPGVRHATPHVGCGLATARAVLAALASDSAPAAVFTAEDDAVRRVEWATVCAHIEEALARVSEWDCVSLGSQVHASQPLPDRVESVSPSFLRCSHSFAISGCTAMLWARSAAPFLTAYERTLAAAQTAIPIDRVVFGGVWNAWGPVSDFSAPYDSELTVEDAAQPVDAALAPRTWLSKRQLVFQRVGDTSDNTGQVTRDLRTLDDKGFAALCRKAGKETVAVGASVDAVGASVDAVGASVDAVGVCVC